jgi:hypothetical protein
LLFSCHPSAKREDLLFAFVFNPESASLKTFTHQHLLAIAVDPTQTACHSDPELVEGEEPRIAFVCCEPEPKDKEAPE